MAKQAEFKDFLSLPALHDFVQAAGFRNPTAVQKAAIPLILSGKSVSVLAQTGSGKTLAYALPIVELLKKQERLERQEGSESSEDADPESLGVAQATQATQTTRAPRAWIVAPTRELGAQIEKVFKSIAHLAKLRVRHLTGGFGSKESRVAVTGPIDVVITSPNRGLLALRRGELKADATRFLVFDEADQLFDSGFLADVTALASRLGSEHLQVGLFSATMPGTFALLRKQSFPGIEFDELILQGSHTLKDNIATHNYTVPFKDKSVHAVSLLHKVEGAGFVFVNLKQTATAVFEELTAALPDKHVCLLHGGMDKKERRKAMAQFADGGDFLVCTDIAARGLDLLGANWLINYDLPFEPVYYMHRCGRVGRTGAPAHVHNLVTTKDRQLIERINTAIANQASLKLSRVVAKRDMGPARAKDSAASRGTKNRGRADNDRKVQGAAKGTRGGTKTVPKPTSGRAAAPASHSHRNDEKTTGSRTTGGNVAGDRTTGNRTTAGRTTAGRATGNKTDAAAAGGKRASRRISKGPKWAGNKPGGKPSRRKGR